MRISDWSSDVCSSDLGAMLPFVFAALTIDAVGRTANKMIEEVRRQFREIPGLREGKEGVEPEYAKCVDISTGAALKEMLIPGGLAIELGRASCWAGACQYVSH